MQAKFPLRGNRGVVLVTIIIVFLFFSTIGLALIALLYSHITAVQLEIDRIKSLYLAEAGIAQSLYEMRVGIDKDNDGLGNIKAKTFGNGRFWVEHNTKTSTITSTGESNNVKRTIQIMYNAI